MIKNCKYYNYILTINGKSNKYEISHGDYEEYNDDVLQCLNSNENCDY